MLHAYAEMVFKINNYQLSMMVLTCEIISYLTWMANSNMHENSHFFVISYSSTFVVPG